MSIEELLKTLHQDYLKSLPEKIGTIEKQVQAGDTGNVRESFHKLKGTGKTYGFPEVSELAALVEGICIAQPKVGLVAATHAVQVLHSIYSSRQTAGAYSLDSDPRMSEIQKLLPT